LKKLYKYIPELLTLGFWVFSLYFILSADSRLRKFVAKLLVIYLVVWGLFFLLSKVSRSEKALRFIITTISFGILFGSLEALTFFKVVDYRTVFATPILPPWRKPTNILDRELIYKHKPYERYKGTTKGLIAWLFEIPDAKEYHYEVQYDKHGFRNDKDYDKADIAVIGDSFIEGAKVPTGQLITTILKEHLNKTVVNFGLIGYGPNQYNIILKRYAIPLNPKIVVWTFYEGNDLDNVNSYNEMISNWEYYSRSFHSFQDRSFLKNFALVFDRILGNERKKSAENLLGIIKTGNGKTARVYLLNPSLPLSEDELSALNEIRSLLSSAYQICKSNNTNLIVLYAPAKFRVYHDIAEFKAGSVCNDWVVNDLPERFRTMLAQISNEIGFIDLTPSFKQAALNNNQPFFYDDTHWSAAGHKIAAEQVEHYINQSIDNPLQASDNISKRN